MSNIPSPQPGVNYADVSSANKSFQNLTSACQALGWQPDGKAWNEDIRPALITFIRTKDLQHLDINKRKSSDAGIFDQAVNDFIDSNFPGFTIPRAFFFVALRTIFKNLRNNSREIKTEKSKTGRS